VPYGNVWCVVIRILVRYHHTVRTTVDIDPHLLKRLRDEAHRRGTTFKAFLAGVIRRGLEDPPAPRARYRCPTFAMGEPRGDVDLDKALAIAGRLEDEETTRELARRK
jgi:hypothetical protein